jgi:hypothetical protein
MVLNVQVTHLLGVLSFGGFCYLLGASKQLQHQTHLPDGSACNAELLTALVLFAGPQDVPYVYCLFYVIFVPLRWIYYRYKKWHYYLLVSAVLPNFFVSESWECKHCIHASKEDVLSLA